MLLYHPIFTLSSTFLKFLKKFFREDICSPVFWGSLISVTQQETFVKYFFKLFSSFFLGIFYCVLSRDSLTILSLLFRFVKAFFDIFCILYFNCTTHKTIHLLLCIFDNNCFNTLKKQSVLTPRFCAFRVYSP